MTLPKQITQQYLDSIDEKVLQAISYAEEGWSIQMCLSKVGLRPSQYRKFYKASKHWPEFYQVLNRINPRRYNLPNGHKIQGTDTLNKGARTS